MRKLLVHLNAIAHTPPLPSGNSTYKDDAVGEEGRMERRASLLQVTSALAQALRSL
jgi:hypothetical protein